MVNPHNIISKIIGPHKGHIRGDCRSKNKVEGYDMDFPEYECYVCGKTISYPAFRFDKPLCSKCAEEGDKAYKKVAQSRLK